MANEGLITEEQAIARVDPAALDQLLHPTLDPQAVRDVVTKGLPASPGAASGTVVFDADTAEKRAGLGEDVILVRTETSPEDIHGMHAARGILRSEEHTSELQSLMRISYAVFCLKKKKTQNNKIQHQATKQQTL